MKHPHYFFSAMLLLLPLVSVSQRQMNVRALDITEQSSLDNFTLLVVHEKDTTAMIVSAENPPLTLSSGSYEIIIQKEGYQAASTEKWDCTADTATVSIEFRLLKEDATRKEIRKGRRNSREMGIDYTLNPVNTGGFKEIRAGIGHHFTSVVCIITRDSFATHCVAE